MQGLGIGVWGLKFRVSGLGFRVEGLEFSLQREWEETHCTAWPVAMAMRSDCTISLAPLSFSS